MHLCVQAEKVTNPVHVSAMTPTHHGLPWHEKLWNDETICDVGELATQKEQQLGQPWRIQPNRIYP